MTTPPREPAARRPTRRRRRRLLLVLAAALALAGTVRGLLPVGIAYGLERGLAQTFDLGVRVGNVDLWLLRGAVSLEEVVVGERPAPEAPPDPERALLRGRRLLARLDWGELVRRRLRLRELVLDSPAVRLERDAQGRIRLPERRAPPPEPKPREAEEDAAGLGFALDRLVLRDGSFRLVDAVAGTEPLVLTLAELEVSGIELGDAAIGIDAVALREPGLRVRRDLASTAGAGAETPAEETSPAAPVQAPLRVRIGRVSVEKAGLALVGGPAPLEATLGLSASDVRTEAGERFPVRLELDLDPGTIALEGELALAPLGFAGHVGWQDLALQPLARGLRPGLEDWLRSGRAGGEVSVDARTAPGPEAGVRLRGRLAVEALSLRAPEDEELALDWKQVEVVVREAFLPLDDAPASPPTPLRIALERLRIAQPELRLARPAPAFDALRGSPPGPAEQTPGRPVEVSLDALELEAGDLRFLDRAVSPPYRVRVRDLAMTARALRLAGPRAGELRVSGRAPRRASFLLTGSLPSDQGEFSLRVQRLSLAPLNPYATRAAGYRIEQGEASLESSLRVRGPRYEADNRLVLHGLRVGGSDDGFFQQQLGVPLDLALALLRDPRGDIRLSIPVAVGEQGARTGLRPVVTGAIRQALLGALSTPLKLVGAVLRPGGEQGVAVEPLASPPGAVPLTPGSGSRLEGLANLLAARPALSVELRGRSGPADRAPLAERMLQERVLAGQSLTELEGADGGARHRVEEALAARGRGELGALAPEDEALLQRNRAALPVPEAQLTKLARERAAALRERLIAEHDLEADRVRVAEEAASGAPGVQVDLFASEPVTP